jgi:hypothetical protein
VKELWQNWEEPEPDSKDEPDTDEDSLLGLIQELARGLAATARVAYRLPTSAASSKPSSAAPALASSAVLDGAQLRSALAVLGFVVRRVSPRDVTIQNALKPILGLCSALSFSCSAWYEWLISALCVGITEDVVTVLVGERVPSPSASGDAKTAADPIKVNPPNFWSVQQPLTFFI